MDELRTDDPRWIGAYRLLGRLGTGGMGRVYLARSERGRTVAVKLVRAELAEQDEFRSRFRREVQAARRVGGKWTAPVLDADTEAEIPWVATGYVAGPSLAQVVAKDHGPLPERSVRVLAAGLAHALADIHAAGLVHRDLKPSNVMITIDGPRVIDFGIARALETVADASITHTGAMVGSPAFMSPEQVRGDRVTPACDIFCLGSVLAYAATGLQPFGAAASGVHAQMFRIAQEPPDLHAVPAGLRDLVAACLTKEPAGRPSLTEVQALLAASSVAADDGEPWLPAGIVARLGRHAVELLELEAAETGSLPVVREGAGWKAANGPASGSPLSAGGGSAPAARPAEAAEAAATALPAAVPPAAEVVPDPTVVSGSGFPAPQPYPPPQRTAVTHPESAAQQHPQPSPQQWYASAGAPAPHGPSRPPARSRSRRGPLVAALAALAVIAAATAALLVARSHDGGTRSSPPAGSPTRTHSPTTAPAAADSGIPSAMVGVWQTSFTTSLGDNTRTLTIHPNGSVELRGTGDGYSCVWTMRVTSAGPPVELSPSKVTSGTPVSSCHPGGATALTLIDPTHLRRDNLDSSLQPLTYQKAG